MGVISSAYDSNGKALKNRVQLHVWGGGVDQRIWIDDQVKDDAFLTSQPRATHHYYFAQLKDAAGKPISKVYPIETFAEPSASCQKNLINLTFEQRR
jgi:hypothetical protein